MRDRDRLEGEAVELGALFQRRDRLLAIGAVVIDEADLLALELVYAAPLVGDVQDGVVGGGPIGSDGDEVPWEHRAFAAFRSPVSHCQQRDFVAGPLLS